MKLILLFVCFTVSTSLLSQVMDSFFQVSGNNFSYKGIEGELHEFDEFFKTDKELYAEFKKFNSNRKTQIFLNYFGSGIVLASNISGFIWADKLQDPYTDVIGKYHGLFHGIGTMFGGFISFIGNRTAGFTKKKFKKSLLQKLSEIEIKSYNKNSQNYLELKATNNGIGIVYTF